MSEGPYRVDAGGNPSGPDGPIIGPGYTHIGEWAVRELNAAFAAGATSRPAPDVDAKNYREALQRISGTVDGTEWNEQEGHRPDWRATARECGDIADDALRVFRKLGLSAGGVVADEILEVVAESSDAGSKPVVYIAYPTPRPPDVDAIAREAAEAVMHEHTNPNLDTGVAAAIIRAAIEKATRSE